MHKKLFLSIILLLTLFSVAIAAEPSDERDCLYYFYGKDCTGCQSSNQYIQELRTTYPNLEIQSYEIYHNEQNKKLLESYLTAYNIPTESQGIPAIITKSSYFIGQKSISTFLEKYIQDNEESSCPTLQATNMVGILGDKNPTDVLKTLPSSLLYSNAFKDSLRPVMFAVIIILALLIISIHDYKKTILGSILFILAFYLAFILYGTNNSSGFDVQRGFILFITCLAILLALVKIIIFFLFNNDPFGNLERTDRIKMEKTKTILSHPAWFFLIGYIVALFTFPNFNKNFELLRTLHLEGVLTSIVTPKIIVYGIYLILPLIILTILLNVIKTKLEQHSKNASHSDQHFSQWKLHNHRVFNVVASILVIAISLVLIYG